MTDSEIRSAFSALNLSIDVNLLNQIIKGITLDKQLTQIDLRNLKMHCPNVAELFKVLRTIKTQIPDLIIVSDEDAFSFD